MRKTNGNENGFKSILETTLRNSSNILCNFHFVMCFNKWICLISVLWWWWLTYIGVKSRVASYEKHNLLLVLKWFQMGNVICYSSFWWCGAVQNEYYNVLWFVVIVLADGVLLVFCGGISSSGWPTRQWSY